MSVLTKIFVVLVTLLSVALVAAMVPFVANTQNWRQKFDAERSARELAVHSAQAKQQLLDWARSNKLAEVEEKSRQIQKLEGQIEGLTSDQIASDVEIKKYHFEVDKLRLTESQMRASLKIQIETISAQAGELQNRRATMRDQAKQLVELEQRVGELHNDHDALTQRLRYYKEEIVAREHSMRKLEDSLTLIPQEIVDTYTTRGGVLGQIDPTHEIEGLVTEVRVVGNDTFVEVNVGQVDGVLQRMRFIVQRGDKYVGTLVVTAVEQRNAAGQMKLANHEVTKGDTVMAGPSFPAANH